MLVHNGLITLNRFQFIKPLQSMGVEKAQAQLAPPQFSKFSKFLEEHKTILKDIFEEVLY